MVEYGHGCTFRADQLRPLDQQARAGGLARVIQRGGYENDHKHLSQHQNAYVAVLMRLTKTVTLTPIMTA
jgi:hypothetical protein